MKQVKNYDDETVDDLAKKAVDSISDGVDGEHEIAHETVEVIDSGEANEHDDSDDLTNNDVSADDAKRAPTFAELGVPEPLVRVLAADGKTTAFPIQADTLPDSLSGRDVLGRGKTGSGKTLAYALPLVSRLSNDTERGADNAAQHGKQDHGSRSRAGSRSNTRMPQPRALVLAPTRELVNQIDEVISPLAGVYGIKTATIYGGVNQNRQVTQLRAGADIVVACPGRLEDLLRQRLLTLESVEITVLDEADEMSDMGFLPAVTRLLEQVEPSGQHMLFSATLDHGVDKIVKRFLHDAKVHAVDSAQSHVDTMTHHVFAVTKGDKYEVIRQLASGTGKRILFTRTKYQAKNMAKKLIGSGIPAVDLQGNLSQTARDRNLAAFTNGEVRVLVATDVAARGIDVSDVALVVQTEPPEDPKSFLHRSGRTARAGQSGDVVTLVLPEQRHAAQSMFRQAGIHAHSETVAPGSPVLNELVGEHAELVRDWSLVAPIIHASGSKSGSSRSGRTRSGRSHSRNSRSHEYNADDSRRSSSGSHGSTRRASADRERFGDENGPIEPIHRHEHRGDQDRHHNQDGNRARRRSDRNPRADAGENAQQRWDRTVSRSSHRGR